MKIYVKRKVNIV